MNEVVAESAGDVVGFVEVGMLPPPPGWAPDAAGVDDGDGDSLFGGGEGAERLEVARAGADGADDDLPYLGNLVVAASARRCVCGVGPSVQSELVRELAARRCFFLSLSLTLTLTGWFTVARGPLMAAMIQTRCRDEPRALWRGICDAAARVRRPLRVSGAYECRRPGNVRPFDSSQQQNSRPSNLTNEHQGPGSLLRALCDATIHSHGLSFMFSPQVCRARVCASAA